MYAVNVCSHAKSIHLSSVHIDVVDFVKKKKIANHCRYVIKWSHIIRNVISTQIYDYEKRACVCYFFHITKKKIRYSRLQQHRLKFIFTTLPHFPSRGTNSNFAKKNIQIELNNNNNNKNEDDTIICKLFDKSYTPQNAGLIIVREKNANMWTSIPHFA